MSLTEEIIKFIKNFPFSLPEVTILAVTIILFGLILLSFTYILPILAFAAALVLIISAIYIVYKFLGGK